MTLGLAMLGTLVAMYGFPGSRPRRIEPTASTILDLARLLQLGVRAGLPLAAALDAALAEVVGPVALELERILRIGHRKGLATALGEAGGALAPLAARLAGAQVSGAPIRHALEAFVQSERRAETARALERARTLPVKLVLPLSLLLLPGFVLLVAGPFVLNQVLELGVVVP